MASSSSSPTPSVIKKYDVFINFRGKDTRYCFASTLHGLLLEKNIIVFFDDELEKGDEISSSLMNAIEESEISVVIFSERYASSRWCLEELVKIIECKQMHQQMVRPIFYHVDPSSVSNQTGTFGEEFAKLVKSFNKEKLEKLQMTEEQFKDKIQTWKNALTTAANLAGYTATNRTATFDIAMRVVQEVLRKLDDLHSDADNKNLVGIQGMLSTKIIL
ncbi:toll/interleukin-1 receptor-like protein [Pistacia vera]|uniref:toll/interleukin-1 receptor-like protein n=1 Tax=Pistacia vera TaxID=55513 RepID=UPI0012634ADA|nr:toll/interleukin-1 receptor-like protein [Pistacia vera]